ncbi:MAG: 2-amino-4-hydroxy-6-hydroxymethyldihydropteridine diphosphokinase [Aquabacterium sp.]
MGGNLGDVQAHLRSALAGLDALPGTRVEAVSSVYKTTPVDAGGPDYLNAVAVLESALGPLELLHALQGLETAHDRTRDYQNAPRTLDLDLLWYGDARRQTARLTMPHPRMMQRAFVLTPLAEVLQSLPADADAALRAAMPSAPDRQALEAAQGIALLGALAWRRPG